MRVNCLLQGQLTRTTQPFILWRLVNWVPVVSCNQMSATSLGCCHLVNAYRVRARCGRLERWCVC